MLFYFAKQNDHHISNFNLTKVALPQIGYSEGLLKHVFVVWGGGILCSDRACPL